MYYKENTLVFLNGEWKKAKEATTSLYGQTMHYGNGVFEGIRSYQTKNGVQIFKAEEHYERLLYSAKKMHIQVGYKVEELVELSYQLLEKNNLKDAYIRPLVYLDPNMGLTPVEGSHLFLCAWEWGKYLGNDLLNVMTSSFQRPNPKSCFVESKTVGHYTNSILATTEAKQNGFDEGLLLDMNGYVAEGPGANFFYEKEGVLYTSPLGNILPGITRSTILELASNFNIEVRETYFTPDDVKRADGAFFTGTAAEVVGIKSLDKVFFQKNWMDTMGYTLAQAYQKLVTGEA